MWVTAADLPTGAGHPFFERLNRVLEEAGFDAFAEKLCAVFYADRMGRPSLRPGRYFRLLFIGCFEGLSSERGIAWRVADSLSLRAFLNLDLTEAPPNHSTLSRTRRLIDVETHAAVFTWVLERLARAGLVKGKTVGVDATTLEANAAMRSIERRDTRESYEAFVRRLAEASGIETPTRAELARFDRSRKGRKTGSPQTSVGRLKRDRRAGRGCGSAGGFGSAGHGVYRPGTGRTAAGRAGRRHGCGTGGVSTRFARPPLRSGPSGDTPPAPPLKRQLRALRPGPDGIVRAVRDDAADGGLRRDSANRPSEPAPIRTRGATGAPRLPKRLQNAGASCSHGREPPRPARRRAPCVRLHYYGG